MEYFTIILIAVSGCCFAIILFFIIHICLKKKSLFCCCNEEIEDPQALLEDPDGPTRTKKYSPPKYGDVFPFKEPFKDKDYYDKPITSKHTTPFQCQTIKQQKSSAPPIFHFVDENGVEVVRSQRAVDDISEAESVYSDVSTEDEKNLIKPGERAGGCKLNFSLSYSEHNSSVVTSLGELSGVARPFSRGKDYVRVSVTLVPRNESRRTKLRMLGPSGGVNVGETFKFSDISRDVLASSILRFRLYGRISDTLEVCVGQMCYKLSDVLDNNGNGNLAMSIVFDKSTLKLRYLRK